jgi:transposase
VFDLFTHPDNREGEAFDWQRCSYENHADYNAVENVGLGYLRRSQTGGDKGALLRCEAKRCLCNSDNRRL